MKILLIAKPWKGGLGAYFHRALEDMFPRSVTWISTRHQGGADHAAYRRDPAAWWNALRQRIQTTPHDAAFFCGWHREFRALPYDTRNILYMVDAVKPAPGDLDPFARVFLSDPGYVSELLSMLPQERYGGILPFAFLPDLHKPESETAPRRHACFIGNSDAKRDLWLASLFARKTPLQVIGNYFLSRKLVFWRQPWRFRPAVGNAAMGGIYARHAVSLNIHAAVVREGTNMRSFEAAGYGIAQIIEHRPHIEDYFEPEREILLAKTPEEMSAQTARLLADPNLALNLAARARQRALAEHTYRHRLETLLAHLR